MALLPHRECRGHRGCHESGSITPLAIGFAVMALMLSVVIVIISDVYMAHRKLYALADSAALAAAESYKPVPGPVPTYTFDAQQIERRANDYLVKIPPPQGLSDVSISASPADSRNVAVTVHARYHPVLVSAFVPGGIELSSTAHTRGTLR